MKYTNKLLIALIFILLLPNYSYTQSSDNLINDIDNTNKNIGETLDTLENTIKTIEDGIKLIEDGMKLVDQVGKIFCDVPCKALEAFLEENYSLSSVLFRKCADKGNQGCQMMAAAHYWDGLGVIQNFPKAEMYLKKASKKRNIISRTWDFNFNGHEYASHHLGELYFDFEYYDKASQMFYETIQFAESKHYLAYMYFHGLLFKKNLREAKKLALNAEKSKRISEDVGENYTLLSQIFFEEQNFATSEMYAKLGIDQGDYLAYVMMYALIECQKIKGYSADQAQDYLEIAKSVDPAVETYLELECE